MVSPGKTHFGIRGPARHSSGIDFIMTKDVWSTTTSDRTIGHALESFTMEVERTSPETERTATLRMFLLDVLRHDEIEQASSMVTILNDVDCMGWREFWPHDFTVNEIWPQLK